MRALLPTRPMTEEKFRAICFEELKDQAAVTELAFEDTSMLLVFAVTNMFLKELTHTPNAILLRKELRALDTEGKFTFDA